MPEMIYPNGETSTASPTSPDVYYVRSRADLLQYEDARFNSLIQALANFYTTENDQSLWGDILRAIAQELAHFDYFYAYDLVNKNPVFLTPPDIKRRWAANLYINRLYPTLDPVQYDYDYAAMLVNLIPAYQLGATVASLEDIITAYTGLDIPVIELYTLIGQGVYDQSDRNTISVSVTVGGTNPLEDVIQLNQLEAITNALYGAIDLGKPAHVILEFQTVFGSGENLDCHLSPSYLNQAQYNATPEAQQGYYTIYGYVLSNPIGTWTPNAYYSLGTVITDSNGNAQQVLAAGTSSPIAAPLVWNRTLNGLTFDGIGSPPDVEWENVGPKLQDEITVLQWLGLSASMQSLYELYYANTNCVQGGIGGIDDELQITVQLIESSPGNPMLYQAPDLLAGTPKTGLGPSTAPTNWQANNYYPYGSVILTGGYLQLVTVAGTSGSSMPVFNPTQGANTTDGGNTDLGSPPGTGVFWTNAGVPVIVWPPTAVHNPPPSAWRKNTYYQIASQITDPNGYIQQITLAGTTGNTEPNFNMNIGGITGPDGSAAWTNHGYQYSQNQSILDPNQFVQVISISGTGFQEWESRASYVVGETLIDANGYVQKVTTAGVSGISYPIFDEALGAVTPDGTMKWTTQYLFEWNQTLGGVTLDGSTYWVNFGRAPGLVAPHINQVWEAQGDQFLGLDVS